MFFCKEEKNPVILTFSVFLVMFLLAGGSFIFGLQQVTTLILVPLLFLSVFFFFRENPFKWSVEFSVYILFLLSAFISLPFSVDLTHGLSQINQIVGAILIAYIVLSVNKDHDLFTVLFLAQILSILLLVAYMVKQGNLNFGSFQEKGDRSRFLLPANTYNYFIFFANMSAFYLRQRYKNIFTLGLVIILPFIFLTVVFAIAARQGIILLVFMNFAYWLYVLDSGRFQIRKLLISVVLIFIIFFGFNNYYKGSYLESRTDRSMEQGDSRSVLISEAIVMFYDHPFLGVGPGQSKFYSKIGGYTHNAYVEALATQGIIGFALLMILYLYPIFELIPMFKARGPDIVYLRLNLVFFITFLIVNMFRPFYLYPSLMPFFFVIVSFQKNLKAKCLIE